MTEKHIVQGCGFCPFAKESSDGHTTFLDCEAPGAPRGYESMLEPGRIPEWCPAIEGVQINLDLESLKLQRRSDEIRSAVGPRGSGAV